MITRYTFLGNLEIDMIDLMEIVVGFFTPFLLEREWVGRG
jgi:hypothetical protein